MDRIEVPMKHLERIEDTGLIRLVNIVMPFKGGQDNVERRTYFKEKNLFKEAKKDGNSKRNPGTKIPTF